MQGRRNEQGTPRLAAGWAIGLVAFAACTCARAADDAAPPAAALALRQQSLAASCAACHGTQGRPPAGSSIPPLAGLPKRELVERMRAFREGSRPSTVMQQLAKGYSDAQIEALGAFFAMQPASDTP